MKRLVIPIVFFALLIFLCGCGGSGGDTKTDYSNVETEPNDAFSTAQKIEVDGTEITAQINTAGDPDYYVFNGTRRNTYRVTVTWISGDNLNLKFSCYEFNGADILDMDKNGAKENETGTIYFANVGTCYLRIVDSSGLNTGSYKISVSTENG